jgi:predicted dehydrogenase
MSMQSNAKLRIGIIGAGGIGATHVRAFGKWPGACIVVAIADPDLARAEMLAAQCGAHAYADPVALFEEAELDAVCVATPPNLHSELACAAAMRGLAVLCEKPPARTLEETQELVACAEMHGTVLQFGFCHRFHTPLRAACELVQQGLMGDVVQIYNRFAFRFTRAGTSWFTDPAVAGGGVLIDTAVHSIDIFRMIAGEIVEVEAMVSTSLPIEVEDSATLLVKSRTGVTGVLMSSWATPVAEAEVRIHGTEGMAIVDYKDSPGLRYKRAGDTGSIEVEESGPDRFAYQAEAFLLAVAKGKIEQNGGSDAIEVMRVIDAAYRSSTVRAPVLITSDSTIP